ncbi:MAG: hypothetical protein Q4G05_06930 [Clostridia bacterium]|nr:hypothetical protein [Clostridia bacterium]
MKKYLKGIVAVAFIFVMAIALTGCGDKQSGGGTTGGSKTYSFPTASFIPSGMEYTGSGKVMYSATKESISPKQAEVYVTGAKVEDVVAYVQTLKSKGLKNANAYKEEQTGFDKYGSYSWVGVNSDDTFSLSIALSEDETDLNLVTGTYNLFISMSTENPYAE